MKYTENTGKYGFPGFSRFSNRPGRFEFLLNSNRIGVTAFHTASTRSIHPRPPFPQYQLSFFPNSPSPNLGGPIVRQILPNGQYYIFSISTSTVFPIYGTPHRVVDNTLLYRHVSPEHKVLGRYSESEPSHFQTYPKA